MTIFHGNLYFGNEQLPFYIDRYTIERMETIPLHTHDFVELVYVVSGNAWHEMGEQIYQLSPGNVFVLEPNVYHSYKGSNNEETVVYNVLFGLDILNEEMAILQRMPSFVDFFYLAPFLRKSAFVPYHPLREYQRTHMEQNLSMLYQEYQSKLDGFELIVKTRLIEMMVLLSRYHEENRSASGRGLSDQEWMEAIKHYVDRHYNQALTLEQLSHYCGMSVSTFTFKWKSATGQSLIHYKQTVQIREACRLLDSTPRKVLDIAHEVGIHDISFFNKIFRKHTGHSPRSYRKR